MDVGAEFQKLYNVFLAAQKTSSQWNNRKRARLGASRRRRLGTLGQEFLIQENDPDKSDPMIMYSYLKPIEFIS